MASLKGSIDYAHRVDSKDYLLYAMPESARRQSSSRGLYSKPLDLWTSVHRGDVMKTKDKRLVDNPSIL